MAMDSTVVRSWKEYTDTADRDTSPVRSIDIAELAHGGMISLSWEDSYSCCGSTLCAGCTVETC